MRKDPKPVVADQYLAAQIYFACVMGMLILESFFFYLPAQIMKIVTSGSYMKKGGKHSELRVLLHKATTWPSLVPFLTNHNLPDILRFLVFAGLNILFGYNRLRFTTDYKLYGWLTIAAGGASLVLSPRATNLFSILLRIPSPVVLYYHRITGLAAITHATVHWGATAAHYVRTDQLETTLTSTFTKWGLVAWSALVIIALTALCRVVRRRAFEVFYYAHFSFLLFILGACLHADHSPEFVLPGFGLWVIDRIFRFASNFRRVTPVSIVHYPGDLTKFKLEGVKVTRPNQMAWVQFSGVSFLNWHPFTIASAPGDKHSTIAIRGLGGFSKKVQNLAVVGHHQPGSVAEKSDAKMSVSCGAVRIRVDGPYGYGGVVWEQYPVIVLVAGGIGITPAVSIASHIVRIAATSTPNGNCHRGRHIHLLWSVRDKQHAQWFEEELSELARTIAETGAPVTLDVSIFASGSPAMSTLGMTPAAEESSVDRTYAYRGPGSIRPGRANIKAWLEDVRARRRGLDAAVGLCGPRPMVDGARKAAASLSSETGLFHVEEEIFEF